MAMSVEFYSPFIQILPNRHAGYCFSWCSISGICNHDKKRLLCHICSCFFIDLCSGSDEEDLQEVPPSTDPSPAKKAKKSRGGLADVILIRERWRDRELLICEKELALQEKIRAEEQERQKRLEAEKQARDKREEQQQQQQSMLMELMRQQMNMMQQLTNRLQKWLSVSMACE